MKTGFLFSSWIAHVSKLLMLCASSGVLAQAPSILLNLQDRAVPAGSTITFTVFATGGLPLSYHWSFNRTQQLAEVSSTLTLVNASAASAGDYSVIVSNAFGAVTSAPASLIILPLLPGVLDTTFNPGDGPNNVVHSVTTDADGRIYLGGEFSVFNGVPRAYVARLNPDGALDPSFVAGSGPSQPVYTVVVQDNGQVLIGGAFQQVNGVLRYGLARLNGDGAVDATFDAGLPSFAAIRAIDLQNDGKIIIGGDFTSVGGVSRFRIARLNTDGSLDTSFLPGSGMNDSVRAIRVRPDGLIWVGGAFTFVDSSPRNRIARLTNTGSVDPSFAANNGANSWIYALGLQPDGQVILGGNFGMVNDVARFNLARLNPNGALDTSFNRGFGPDGTVTALALQPDGKLVIGGGFLHVQQQPRSYFARLTSDGLIDEGFYSDAGASYWVESVALQADGKILIGGGFHTVNGVTRPYVARLIGGDADPFVPLFTTQPVPLQTLSEGGNVELAGRAIGFPLPSYRWQLNGTNLPAATVPTLALNNVRLADAGNYVLIASNALGSTTSRVAVVNINPARTGPGAVDINFFAGLGPNYAVKSIAAQPDGKILIGGYFYLVDGMGATNIARLNADGTLDSSFQASAPYSVEKIAVLPSGSILIGGPFYSVNGTFRSGIAMLNTDGSIDASFNPLPQVPAYVSSFLPQANGRVVIAGYFSIVDGVARTNVARLNSNGSLDASFDAGTGSNGEILALAAHTGGKILMGGNFGYFNGVPRNGIVRLNADGSVDSDFNSGTGANGTVDSISVQSDGKILIGGGFRAFNGVSRHQVARLNTDGSLDLTFDPGEGPDALVKTVLAQSDGKIVLGGGFIQVNGTTQNRVARLNSDGSLDLTFDAGAGADEMVYSIVELPGDRLMIGGAFTSFDLLPRPYLVRLVGGKLPTSPPAIVVPPQSMGVQAGEDATFHVLAMGEPELRYQWQVNGTNIPGATHWTLTLPNVRSTNAGDYTVIVSNALGFAMSPGAALSVNSPSRQPGAPDISFYTGTGPNDRVHAIAVQGDGQIVIGGAFTEVNGTLRNHIARLTSSGSVDATFNPGLGANERVFAVAVQPDGRIVAGGSFTNVNGLARDRVVRFETNGAVDLGFNTALGPNAEVHAVAGYTNGSVIIGGRFTFVNGVPRNGVARLHADGSVDFSFAPLVNQGAVIFALAVQADGQILIGGFFQYIGGVQRTHIARFNANGSIDGSFLTSGASSTVSALGLQPDGKVMLGGDFFAVDGAQRIRLARLLPNGPVDFTFNNAIPNDSVSTLLVQPNTNVVAGGRFTGLNFVPRNRLARLDHLGVPDPVFNAGPGVQGGSSYVDEYGQIYELTTVLASAREPGGKILIGGDFTSVNGIERPYIARLFGREASDAIAVHHGSGMVQVRWDTGVIQVADQITGPWSDLPNAESPIMYQLGEAQKFFRLKFN
ncbi:MAG TPA: immunoglobulin domain-containing protein [Methylomirabilota bacterium]|nr:immunoglobulin domain-containing protein [Methylomirabilota bacterium]